nr:hypothetical protein [Tanacetum cinerariifolium]
MDFALRTSTSTSFVRWLKPTEANLLSTSAFWFRFWGIFSIENILKRATCSFALARPTNNASYSASLLVLEKVSKNRRARSADLEKNQFKAANFPFRLCISLQVFGDCISATALVFLGFTLIPSEVVGIKSLLDAVGITSAHVCVNTAQLERARSADLEKNQFKAANFPFRLCISLQVFGDCISSTALVFLGFAFIPSE